MALPWIRVENALPDHPKVFALSAALGDPNAGWYLIRLWSWTSRYAARGRLASGARPALEVACGWRGTPGGLVSALIGAGFLDEVEDGLEVHGWWDMQGQAIEKSKKDAERKRERRADGAETARVRRASGARTARVRDVTIRDVSKEEPASQAQAQMKTTTDRLIATYNQVTGCAYEFIGGRDATAVAALLKANSTDEIDRRWRIALAHKEFPRVTNLGELRSHWNRFVAPAKPIDPPMRRV